MQILIYIIIFIAGVITGNSLFRKKLGGPTTKFSASSERMSELSKEAKVALKERTDKRKSRIMELAEKQEKITNDNVEDMFCISDSTARAYLNELEQEGKLEQIGETGRGVHYVIMEGSQS